MLVSPSIATCIQRAAGSSSPCPCRLRSWSVAWSGWCKPSFGGHPCAGSARSWGDRLSGGVFGRFGCSDVDGGDVPVSAINDQWGSVPAVVGWHHRCPVHRDRRHLVAENFRRCLLNGAPLSATRPLQHRSAVNAPPTRTDDCRCLLRNCHHVGPSIPPDIPSGV